MGLLWPESDEEKARRVLAQTLYSLRRDLGADDLIVGTTELRANSQILSADLRDFQNAAERGDGEAAASIYAGPFLDGFYLPGASEFDRWVDETRTGLAHQYVAILERLVEAACAKHDLAAEIGWCRKLAAAEPLSAKHAVRLMQALARSGDRAGALRHARVHEQLMRTELECPSDPAVVALVERLRNEPDPSTIAAAPSVAPTPPTPETPAQYTPRPSAEVEAVGATQEWLLKLAGEPLPNRKSAPVMKSPVINQALPPVAKRLERNGATASPGGGGGGGVHRVWRWAALAVLAVAGLAAAYFQWPRGGPAGGRPVIAIGGITPLAGDTSLVWVAQALPQLVATRLLESPEVEVAPVLPAGSVVSGADSSGAPGIAALRQMGRRLGATVVVRGQLAREAGKYVLHVATYDVATGRTLRTSEIVNTNAFALADAAASQVLEASGQSGAGPSIADLETPNEEAYRAFLRARQALDEGRTPEYVRNLDRAISLDSGFLGAVQERLSLASGGGDNEVAAKLKPLFTRYASRATAWVRLMQSVEDAHYNGETDRALTLAQQLVQRYPRDPRAYATLHGLQMTYGRFAEAESVAARALALDSLGVAAGSGPCAPCVGYRGLTDARVALGRLDAADAAAQGWIRLQPNVPAAWLNAAGLDIVRQRFDSALARVRRAEVLAGGGDAYYDASVRTLIMARRYAEAESAITAALGTARKPIALDMLMLLQRERGQHRAAMRTADRALAEFPGLSWFNLMKASSLSALGDYAGADRLMERITHPGGATTEFPLLGGGARGFAWHHALAADFSARSGDTVRLRILADSVEVGGARSYYGRDWRLPSHIRGLVALQGRRYADAERLLREALWMEAAFTRTNVALAHAYLGMHRPADAVRVLRRAYEVSLDAMARYVPRSELDFELAQAYRAAGNLDSARVYSARVRESWVAADPEMRARLTLLPQ